MIGPDGSAGTAHSQKEGMTANLETWTNSTTLHHQGASTGPPWHRREPDATALRLASGPNGLSQDEARQRFE